MLNSPIGGLPILGKYLLGQLRATDNSHLSAELTNNRSMDSILLPSTISPYLNGYLVKQSETTMMESRKCIADVGGMESFVET